MSERRGTVEDYYTAAEQDVKSITNLRERFGTYDDPIISRMVDRWATVIESMATEFGFDNSRALYSFLSALTGDSVAVVDAVLVDSIIVLDSSTGVPHLGGGQ